MSNYYSSPSPTPSPGEYTNIISAIFHAIGNFFEGEDNSPSPPPDDDKDDDEFDDENHSPKLN